MGWDRNSRRVRFKESFFIIQLMILQFEANLNKFRISLDSINKYIYIYIVFHYIILYHIILYCIILYYNLPK